MNFIENSVFSAEIVLFFLAPFAINRSPEESMTMQCIIIESSPHSERNNY